MRRHKTIQRDDSGIPAFPSSRVSSALGFVMRSRQRIPPGWLAVAAIVMSLAYYYAIPSPTLSLPGLLVFMALAWLRLDLALCLLPLTFPFWFVPKRIGGSVVFPLSEIALAVCCAVALARGVWDLTLGPSPCAEREATRQSPSADDVGQAQHVPGQSFTMATGQSPSADDVGASDGRPPATGQAIAMHAIGAPPAVPASKRLRRSATPLTPDLSRLRRAGAPTLIGAALLLLGTALGVLIARRPHEALRAFRWEVIEPLLYCGLLVLYLRRRHVRLLIGAFLAAALMLAALAAVQVFWLHVTFTPLAQGNRLIPYTTPLGGIPRATAFVLGSGNTLGAWMARALPLALALAIVPRGVSLRMRLLPLLAALACVPALLWSDSRGALAAALVVCAASALLAVPGRRWAVGTALVVAASAALVLLTNRATVLYALLSGHAGSGELRTLVWLAAWHMIRDHPLLGIGPDQFLYYYSNLYTSHPYWILYQNGRRTLAWTEPNLAQPHNLVLDLWLSGGLLALVGFVVVLGALWMRCWRVWHAAGHHVTASQPDAAPAGLQPASVRAPASDGRDSAGWRAAVALGIGASVLAGVLHGMVDSAYFEPDLALIVWWAVAVLIIVAPSRRDVAGE